MLEDRIQHLETSDPATAMADLRPEGCHSREIQCQGSEDLSKPQRVGCESGLSFFLRHRFNVMADSEGEILLLVAAGWRRQPLECKACGCPDC